MEPLKRIDENTPIGVTVIVVVDGGLLISKTDSAPYLSGLNGAPRLAVHVRGYGSVSASSVYVLPPVQP